MARRPVSDLAAWSAVTLEGTLLAPAMIAKIDHMEADGQSAADYGLRRGLSLRDEIATAFRVGQRHWDDFRRLASPGPAAATRFAEAFLRETFGFEDLAPGSHPVALTTGGGRVPVVVVPPGDELDRAADCLSADRRRSAALALQDRLNASEDALWGLALNGRTLRLMRDNASLTRPAYVEADLDALFEAEDIASFGLLWLLIHRSRFGQTGTPPADCALERWRDEGARQGEAARDRLAGQVEEALRVLGSGFLDANPDLRARLDAGDLSITDWFNELLRLVYRLIFLMVAEDRDLLHPDTASSHARRLYTEGYSLAALRAQSVRRAAWDRHHDRWEGMKVVFRALAGGEPRLGLPALGGLFGPHQLVHLEQAQLPNRAFLQALWRLGWIETGGALVPVNWRLMETEELGSVYESLLELQPQRPGDGRTLAFAGEAAEQRGNQRKTTGSYYTPNSLVQALLDTALDPLLDRTEAEAENPAKALLSLAVIDPACGSGHFLLGAARRIATRVARHRAGGTASAADYRHALRDVARCCLHGVDRNPMAVELTKVALWIETVDPGLPLGFFDAQIRCGDALLGIFDRKVLTEGIPDEAYALLSGDDRETARYYLRENRAAREGQGTLGLGAGELSRLPTARPFATRMGEIRAMPEDDLAAVAAKAERFRQVREDQAFYMAEMACDLWTAAFLLPKAGGPPSSRGARRVPTTEDVWEALRGRLPVGPLLDAALEAARAARVLHWPLEFPDVFARGGFDAVVGNPPWERIKLQEQEYFATRAPEIAAASNAAVRGRMIAVLAREPEGSAGRRLHKEFEQAKRLAEAVSSFVRVPEGRFPLTGRGDVNTYALFAELFSRLAGPHGWAGVIMPTGIATDATTAPFFASLVEAQYIASLHCFENEENIFPAVHHAFKFGILTLSKEGVVAPRFCFFLRQPSMLTDPERNFTLSPEQIARLNPNTRTAPVFRSRADADLTARIYDRVPVLIDDERGPAGNPWGVSFARLFDMSNDSHLFRTATQLRAEGYTRQGVDWVTENVRPRQAVMAVERAAASLLPLEGGGPREEQRYVPLYEAKMIHQFDHRWAGYDAAGTGSADATPDQKRDPAWEPAPRYWVPAQDMGGESGVESRLRAKGWTRDWLMGWRDIARATDERTLISGAIPRFGCGDKYLLMMPDQSKALSASLLANMNSLVTDFVVRQKLGGTSFKYFTMRQIPFLLPSFYSDVRLAFVVPRVLELTYTSHTLASFARDLGHAGPPFPWDEARRAHLRAELDAFYARAYGLSRDDLRYVLDPTEAMGPSYPSETFRVLKEKEIRTFGEYRTARLTLAAWDRLAPEFDAMGL